MENNEKRKINIIKLIKGLATLIIVTLIVTVIFGMDFMSEHTLWFLIPWLILAFETLSPAFDKEN